MSNLLIPVARFLARITITVIWALILSKLIRSTWDLIKKYVRRNSNNVATATN
jgi:hypothetical protein